MKSNITVSKGSKELAVERKLIREIIIKLADERPYYEYKKIEEYYDGHKTGYCAVYELIGCGKKDRLQQNLKIVFESCGYGWNSSERIVVRVYGELNIDITMPRSFNISRHLYGCDNEITFHRDRLRHVQSNAVLRLLDKQQIRYDERQQVVIDEMAKWDLFADRVERIKKYFNIIEKDVWRHCHQDPYQIHLSIRATKARESKATIIMRMDGEIGINVKDMSDLELKKVVRAFR